MIKQEWIKKSIYIERFQDVDTYFIFNMKIRC